MTGLESLPGLETIAMFLFEHREILLGLTLTVIAIKIILKVIYIFKFFREHTFLTAVMLVWGSVTIVGYIYYPQLLFNLL